MGYLLTYILGGVSLTGDLFDQYISRLLTLVQLILLLALAYPLLKSRGMARQALLTYSFAAVGLAAGVLLRLPGFEVETETALGTRFSALGYNPNDLSAVIAAMTNNNNESPKCILIEGSLNRNLVNPV